MAIVEQAATDDAPPTDDAPASRVRRLRRLQRRTVKKQGGRRVGLFSQQGHSAVHSVGPAYRMSTVWPPHLGSPPSCSNPGRGTANHCVKERSHYGPKSANLPRRTIVTAHATHTPWFMLASRSGRYYLNATPCRIMSLWAHRPLSALDGMNLARCGMLRWIVTRSPAPGFSRLGAFR